MSTSNYNNCPGNVMIKIWSGSPPPTESAFLTLPGSGKYVTTIYAICYNMQYTAIFAICHYMQYTTICNMLQYAIYYKMQYATICNMLQYAICYNMQYATISNILQYAIYCNMQVRRHLQVPAPGSTCAQLRLDACLKLILRAVEPINLLPYLAPPPSVAPSPPASSPPACCILVSQILQLTWQS